MSEYLCVAICLFDNSDKNPILNQYMGKYRKFVFVCTGSDCKKNGCKRVLKELKSFVGMEPNVGQFKIIKTKCMDFCKSGPIVVYGNEVFKRGELEEFKAHIR